MKKKHLPPFEDLPSAQHIRLPLNAAAVKSTWTTPEDAFDPGFDSSVTFADLGVTFADLGRFTPKEAELIDALREAIEECFAAGEPAQVALDQARCIFEGRVKGHVDGRDMRANFLDATGTRH